MTARKNPYFFTDKILVREISRRTDRKHDDRLSLLLDVVEQRLWERDFRLQMCESDVSRAERRQYELEGLVREALDLVAEVVPPRPSPRPQLTLLRGDADSQVLSQVSASPAVTSGRNGR